MRGQLNYDVDDYMAIHPQFTNLVIVLRTAVENGESTSYED